MEITGKIIAVLPERSGTSASTGNEWRTGAYVLETLEQYPKRMCFDVFGADKLQQFAIQVGEIVTVSFDIDAHDYQGKWFNSIRAWKVVRPGTASNIPIGYPSAPTPSFPGASNTQQPVGAGTYPPVTPGSGQIANSSPEGSLPFPPPNI